MLVHKRSLAACSPKIFAHELLAVSLLCVDEDGEIAAVLVDGGGTLKRWRHKPRNQDTNEAESVRLDPENDTFDPIEITEEDHKNVIVFGKYVGLVRGELQVF